MKKTFSFIFLFFLILLSGCESLPPDTTQAEIVFFDNYGGDIAYMKTSDGIVIKNSNPASINYYIGDLSTKYRSAMIKASAEYSISQLSTYIEVTTNTYNSNSSCKCTSSTPPPGGSCDNPIGCDTQVINLRGTTNETLATNSIFKYENDNSKIVGSIIDFNLTLMWDLAQYEKNYIAIHELGHTFGLIDVKDEIYKNKTVMFYSYGNGVDPVNQLNKLDVANLLWGYGD
jgi:hypothetical protein